jgi:excisionase family DNA binding protein
MASKPDQKHGGKFLRVEDFAAAVTLSPKTIWGWVAARRIAVQRVGRAVRIPESELQRILEEGFTPARRTQNRPHSQASAA